jgi:hypothetical protein
MTRSNISLYHFFDDVNRFYSTDGTHVGVTPPKRERVLYRNRHDTLSLNVTVLGGASGKVFMVKSNCPGSVIKPEIVENC